MNNTQKIKKEIFENPTYHFHIRELAKKTNLNPNTIINIIKKLDIIKKTKKKHLTEIYADIENPEFILGKRLFNLESLYESGLVKNLTDIYKNPSAIVVMGSYSRGEDIEKSDIDIVIITNEKKIIDATKFEKKLKRNIHLILVSYEDMSDEFYTNMLNGVILKGYVRKK